MPSGYNNNMQLFQTEDDVVILNEMVHHARIIFTAPFTVLLPMRRNDEPMFEYACHEGNYGLLNILRGARAEERGRAVAGPARAPVTAPR